MKNILRITSLLLGAVITLSSFSFTAFAEENIRAEVLTGEFTYNFFEGKNTSTYFYSDDYFASSSKDKNEHLRTMSLDLSLSAIGNDRNVKADNALSLLKKIGFDTNNAAVDDYYKAPTMDSIGTIISHKKTQHGDIIAVGIRGSDYLSEWSNNVTSGEKGDIEGFSQSAEKVVKRIKDYEAENNLLGAKLWITGYSRAGAVSDLTGKYVNEHLEEFGITDDDLYVYTFEASRGSADDPEYENIHNVLSPLDIVPQLYPEQWGLYCAGVEEILPAEDTTIYKKTIDIFQQKIVNAVNKNATDSERFYPMKKSEFEKSFIEYFTNNISREAFYNNQDHLRKILYMYFSRNSTQQKALTDCIMNAFSNSKLQLFIG